MSKSILNIAAGKRIPDIYEAGDFLVQLDPMYAHGAHSEFDEIESDFALFMQAEQEGGLYYSPDPAMTFMSKFKWKFDVITIHRYLEHLSSLDELEGFIYMLSTSLKPEGLLEVIVPDHAYLAQMLLAEDSDKPEYAANDIIITTEFCNFPGDPHASIWTVDRMKRRMEKEGRFKTLEIQQEYKFDGRDIYLHGTFQMCITD